MELAEIAARAAGENFPVGSVLFPRALRPHIRALYCYARLVDELGDAYEGDRRHAINLYPARPDGNQGTVEILIDDIPKIRAALDQVERYVRHRPQQARFVRPEDRPPEAA